MKIEVDITTDGKLLQKIVGNVFRAFIETGRYAFSKREAIDTFGITKIDLLIANNLLKDTSKSDFKAQYLLSDIITGLEVLESMKAKKK